MRLSNQTSDQRSNVFLKFLLHFSFLLSGTATILIGQILPMLSTRLSLNDAQAGYFFIAQFSGSVMGTLSTTPVIKRFGFTRSTALGIFLMAVGIFGLNSNLLPGCLAAFFVIGLGIGITLPSINMLTVELNPQNITPALNFLNFFWGVGAIFCKPFIDLFGTQTSILTPTLILSVLLLPLGIGTALAPISKTPEVLSEQDEREKIPLVPIWTTPTAWLIALFNFVHVGFESGIGGWITSYSARFPSRESEIFSWFSPTIAYFLSFVIGRLTARGYSRFFSENKLLLISLILTTSGVIVLLWGSTLGVLAIGASIAGFGTSTIFPTNTARFAKIFGETASRRATPLFVSGTLGAALTTWLIGYISTSYNGLRFGMFVLMASCIVLIGLQLLLSFKLKR